MSNNLKQSLDEFPIILSKKELKDEDDSTVADKDKIVICGNESDDKDEFHSILSNSSSSIFSFSSPNPSSMESFIDNTTIDDLSSRGLSRMESESGLSGKTFIVKLPFEEQIERDSATEEQLARIRKEIEEMEVSDKEKMKYDALIKRNKSSRKDLVKVPLESGLPVALHSRETGKEEDLSGVDGGEFEDHVVEDLNQVNSHDNNNENDSPSQHVGMKIVDEDHRNYILMYDMLTGIRISVSRCQAKPSRPLSPQDFQSSHKMAFDLTGNEETPSSRYDFKFKDYSPWVFRSLREKFNIDAADYLVSLTGKYVLSELYSPGKSGSLFYYSQDYRFIIKTIRESEHLFLRKILSNYHQHITNNSDSLLVRFYGLHRVQLPMGGKKIYFVVMGNLFPNNRPMRSIYDLKGSTHGRWNTDDDDDLTDEMRVNKKGPGPVVLKDLNWLKRREKLVFGPIKATMLMSQLKIDCKFLAKLRIMDYSLLIGLHTLNNDDDFDDSEGQFQFYNDFDGGFQSSFEDNSKGPEVYYLGIIDILTPYSLSKKFEHTFKTLIYPKDSISAVNPTDYARRFLKFMQGNILQNVAADYGRKSLPLLPEVEEYNEGNNDDGFTVISNG